MCPTTPSHPSFQVEPTGHYSSFRVSLISAHAYCKMPQSVLCVDCAGLAHQMYDSAKVLPGRATRGKILEEKHISLNGRPAGASPCTPCIPHAVVPDLCNTCAGPWLADHPYLLTGVDTQSGALCVLKVTSLSLLHVWA